MAGIPLDTPKEGIDELEFAVETLGLKAINIAGSVRRPIRVLAAKFPADRYPELQKYISYQDFYRFHGHPNKREDARGAFDGR